MMTINRAAFFAAVRRSGVAGKPLKAQSVESLEAILDAFERYYPNASLPQIAYCMATARHEAWDPRRKAIRYDIEEIGGAKRAYGRTGFYGRGMVQLTHRANYERAGKALGVDLVADPKLALRKDISAGVLVKGSMLGWFRKGHSLPRYFTGIANDPYGAREIINGDKAKNGTLIAGHYRLFLAALEEAASKTKELPMPRQRLQIPVPIASTVQVGGALAGMLLPGPAGKLISGVANAIADAGADPSVPGLSRPQAAEIAPVVAERVIADPQVQDALAQPKPWYLSTTVWGIAISVLFKLLAVVLPGKVPAEWEGIASGAVPTVISFIGDAMALYGRIKASGPLTAGAPDKPDTNALLLQQLHVMRAEIAALKAGRA